MRTHSIVAWVVTLTALCASASGCSCDGEVGMDDGGRLDDGGSMDAAPTDGDVPGMDGDVVPGDGDVVPGTAPSSATAPCPRA
ncbi:MAG: hypothetical protein M3Y87_24980 [Myxococcota bacterium]|nr:hypothetical protein [Myxococcota bacterium]